MLIKIFRYLLSTILVVIVIIVVSINVKIRHNPEIIIRDHDTIQFELVKELKGLKQALDQNADIEMQKIYPEGYVFFNAIYALAWASFLRHEAHHHYLVEGHSEIQSA